MADDRLLLGQLKQFMTTTTQDIHEIKTDVRVLMAFRWKILGVVSLSSFLASAIVALAFELLRH